MSKYFRLRFDPGIKYAVALGLLMYGAMGALILQTEIASLIQNGNVSFLLIAISIVFIFLGICCVKVCFLRIVVDPEKKNISIPAFAILSTGSENARKNLLNGLWGVIMFPFARQRLIPFSEIKSVLICRHNELPAYAHIYENDDVAHKKFAQYLTGQKLVFDGKISGGSFGHQGLSPVAGMATNIAAGAVANYAISTIKSSYILFIQTNDELISRDSTIFRQEDYRFLAHILQEANVNVYGVQKDLP